MGEGEGINNTRDNSFSCNSSSIRRDCDGDYDVYCTYLGSCKYQYCYRDCDGDPTYKCCK